MKTILVPVDFSEYSEYALKAAALLSNKVDIEILPIHMLGIESSSLSQSESVTDETTVFLYELAKKEFRKFLKKDYLKDIKVKPILKRFKDFTELNNVAKEENADLIIMGSHGTSGLKEFFTGSNTEKVIRYSEIPVMVIKNEVNSFNFSNVVFATDLAVESINSYVRIKSIIDEFNGKLQLLYVNTPQSNFKTAQEMQEMATEFLMKSEGSIDKLKDVSFVDDKSVEQGIFNFSHTVGADLIAVSTHARKGISHLFAGSISEDVANHSSIPILTVQM